ncbi:HAMP domain-containing sensor histidine kinase [Shimia sp. R9_3]|uniref:sensor histidine kinase n=1 Tax=Shimia sp. R9_3 TaxID=2821113 RepID=UPI001AD9FC32|nr:HAMP domain-containing sensor histidine kinase [Shimia sp. R9_3]MBO9399607.1 cache domain-containing protein [Shimia sp. R9_3]
MTDTSAKGSSSASRPTWAWLPRRRSASVRMRLLAIALLPTLVIMPLFFIITAVNWSSRFDNLLIAKVNGELTIADQYLSQLLENSDLRMQALAASADFVDHVRSDDQSGIARLLQVQRVQLGLDFLYYLAADGSVIASPRLVDDRNLARWPVVSQALAGFGSAQIDVFSGEDLAKVSSDLAELARIKLVPTQAAVPTERVEETRGMMVHAATPVSEDGRHGALVGGVLLNRNLPFIDTINDLVYPTASLTEGSQGTATLFLDDVRISTNVRLFQDERALGTRVSAVVREAVLDRGEVWLDRAFVVNDWYISAYEPVTDSFGNRVGMLYVGFLDQPFRDAKFSTILTFAVAFAVIVLISVPIFLRWARQIFAPLERMLRTITRVEGGDLGARTGVENSDEEIARVAAQMDALLEQIQERDRELNRRVAARTQDLAEANRRLEATTRQLVVSEKLAAVGEIAAGIAHEINNPIQVIQGNLDVIRVQLGDRIEDIRTELKLIDEQTHSIFLIVNKLLQFTRPDEYAQGSELHQPSAVMVDTVPLVQHLLNSGDIALQLELESEGAVAINRTELQQVLINLIVNAIHAMPEGGSLRVSTKDDTRDDQAGVLIEVADTGVGMTDAHLSRIFDPFFTTKQGEGTGLGLSISRKLVELYDGTIEADSTIGEGTVFRLWFPCADQG